MKKVVILSTDTYLDLDDSNRERLKEILIASCDNKNAVCFISREIERCNLVKTDFVGIKRVHFKSRSEIQEILTKNEERKNCFIVLGGKDKDFELAVNNKLLFLVPLWNIIREPKALKYGVSVNDLDMLNEIIESLNNQNEWYYELELPDTTKIYSLMCAHSRTWNIPTEEKKLVEGFEDFLKRGNGTYYKILLCHFLAFMSNNPEFRDIDCWSIMPSSGLILNKDMYTFKEMVRYFMKGRVPKDLVNNPEKNNLFLRHTKVRKSHETSAQLRMSEGATVHLGSIYINESYKKGKTGSKLAGKNVCVFDDYLTHGNSFEALRNMLKKAGAEKIIFVSLGRFKRDYIYQDYTIEGDVFSPNGFRFKARHSSELLTGEYNEVARGEVRELANIFDV